MGFLWIFTFKVPLLHSVIYFYMLQDAWENQLPVLWFCIFAFSQLNSTYCLGKAINRLYVPHKTLEEDFSEVTSFTGCSRFCEPSCLRLFSDDRGRFKIPEKIKDCILLFSDTCFAHLTIRCCFIQLECLLTSTLKKKKVFFLFIIPALSLDPTSVCCKQLEWS